MAVKVKRERPDQRRHHRVSAPLYLEVAGHRVRAADWSLGGLRVAAFPGPTPELGAELTLAMTLPFQGFDVSFDAKAEVVRVDADTNSFAVRYTELGEREQELMQHFIEELVRGSMIDVEDTIQRIDVPVTPASLEPENKALAGPVPVRRWPLKTVVMTAAYLVLGAMVFGYAGLLGYTNIFRMEVQTAVISAPVETVKAQVDGRVDWSNYKPGDRIKSGEVLVRLFDDKLEREIELADIAVKERKARLNYLQKRHLDELERLRSFAAVDMKNVRQTTNEVQALSKEVSLAQKMFARIERLHRKGYATNQRLEEAQEKLIQLQKQLVDRRIELNSRVDLADLNYGKRLYTGENVVGDHGDIEAQVDLARHEIELAEQRHKAYINHRERHAVRAPFDGTILDLPKFDTGTVRRGDVVAIIEQRQHRQVTAYLNQDEILKVGLGDTALLYLPALGETVRGRVTAIDRTSGFVREQEERSAPGYSWRGPTDRSAKVTIEFERPDLVADAEKYRSGLPVVVVFEQRSTNSILSAIGHKLSLML